MKTVRSLALLVLFLFVCVPAYGEEVKYNYQTGPQKIELDNKKNILDLPAGYSYLNKVETKKMFDEWKEPYEDSEIGLVVDNNSQCFAILSYDETGYIKDDDADKLDADALLKDYRQGTEAANKERKKQGGKELEVVRWDSPPKYDKVHHVLQWAIRGREKGSKEYILNHKAVLLGRSGKLGCVVVGDGSKTEQLDAMRTLLSSKIKYTEGNDYQSWEKGDKVSDITLAGLITGGAATAAYAAGKAGLLAKLGALLLGLKKGLILIVLAIGALFKKIWNRISGRNTEEEALPAATVETEESESQ